MKFSDRFLESELFSTNWQYFLVEEKDIKKNVTFQNYGAIYDT